MKAVSVPTSKVLAGHNLLTWELSKMLSFKEVSSKTTSTTSSLPKGAAKLRSPSDGTCFTAGMARLAPSLPMGSSEGLPTGGGPTGAEVWAGNKFFPC